MPAWASSSNSLKGAASMADRPELRRFPQVAALAFVLLAAAMLAACGSSSDTSSTSSTSTTNTVESQLQAKLDDATQACTDAAGQLSNSTVQSAGQAACDQLNSSLANDIASAADSAKGDVSEALDNLAKQCSQSVSSLPTGAQDVANSFCDSISASAGSVSG